MKVLWIDFRMFLAESWPLAVSALLGLFTFIAFWADLPNLLRFGLLAGAIVFLWLNSRLANSRRVLEDSEGQNDTMDPTDIGVGFD